MPYYSFKSFKQDQHNTAQIQKILDVLQQESDEQFKYALTDAIQIRMDELKTKIDTGDYADDILNDRISFLRELLITIGMVKSTSGV